MMKKKEWGEWAFGEKNLSVRHSKCSAALQEGWAESKRWGDGWQTLRIIESKRGGVRNQ